MAGDPVQLLLVHGAIVTCIGLVAGFPFWLAILRGRTADRIGAWRVAHTTLLLDGMLLLVVSLLRSHLDIGPAPLALAAVSLVVSAYGFVVALGIGAWAGERGLNPFPPGINTFFFLGHALGAAGATVGMALVLYGLLR